LGELDANDNDTDCDNNADYPTRCGSVDPRESGSSGV
jgi:hypothetical protein